MHIPLNIAVSQLLLLLLLFYDQVLSLGPRFSTSILVRSSSQANIAGEKDKNKCLGHRGKRKRNVKIKWRHLNSLVGQMATMYAINLNLINRHK